MFRSILTKANQFNYTAFTSGFCTKAQATRSGREVNDVTIIGTLATDPYTLVPGINRLTIKTQETPTIYSYHSVLTSGYSDLVAGQRIYVTGRLGSFQRKITEEKNVTASNVHATKLFVLEDECGSIAPKEKDENSIRILGSIANNVAVKDTHCSFSLATHHQRRNKQEEEADFHAVFAYDEDIRQYIQNNLLKSDRVLISGRIGHLKHTLTDGKKKYSAYIVAEGVSKIARRAASQDNSNASEELTQEI